MKAITIKANDIYMSELPEKKPVRGQLLVAPKFCGICGSDLSLINMLATLGEHSPSIVPGHEFSAQVLEIGAETITDLKIGDRIAVIPFVASDSNDTNNLDFDIIGLSEKMQGAMSQTCLVTAKRCVKLDDTVSDELGALIEPLACGRHAANLADRSVAPNIVIGCGPVGLAVIIALKHMGRSPIIAADFSVQRRELAKFFGADVVIDPQESSVFDQLKQIDVSNFPTSPLRPINAVGRPKESVNFFECSGANGMLEQIIAKAPRHSHIIVVGVCPHEQKIQPLTAITNEITLEFSFAYTYQEFKSTIAYVSSHQDTVKRLITSILPFAQAEVGFNKLKNDKNETKILIRIDQQNA